MIGFLEGRIEDKTINSVIIDVGGVGYEVVMPASHIAELPDVGKELKVYTYMQVSDNGIALYGFISKDEKEIFKLLITVSGIGPKGAVGMLSVLSANDIRIAVLSDDVTAISKAPGIGKKTAQKVILELKDKMNLEDVLLIDSGRTAASRQNTASTKVRNDACEALAALGFSASDALRAVNNVENADNMEVEELLKAAMKFL